MQECQEKARDLVKPGYENDPNQIAKVEQALISCMSNQVNEHIKLLKPMKDRYVSATREIISWILLLLLLLLMELILEPTTVSFTYLLID